MNLLNREYIVALSRKKANTHDISGLEFITIPNGINYWVADPFPFEKDGVLYIFGEMYEYSSLKGSIAYCKYDGKLFSPWKKIIEEQYHLSFPNIFEVDGKLYMCPEAHQSKELYLYKCVSFPDIWEKERILAKGVDFCDTVFWKNQDKLYGFACEWESLEKHKLKVFQIRNSELVYIEGRGKQLDDFMSRPAGKIFYDEREKCYVMPAQICKPKYGSAIVFKKFGVNEFEYEEDEIAELSASEIKCDKAHNYDGIHTFNMSDNYIVVDLLWSRFNLIEKTRRGLKKIKKGIRSK